MSGAASTRDALIVGGGLAGLAAAWKLASAGKRVTLLEAKRKLGGRASSFIDPETGEAIDHCQHVAMGCCTEFLGFIKSLGLAHLLSIEKELYFIDERNRISTFRPNRWRPPLHLLPAFYRLRHLTLIEKWKIARAVQKLARADAPTNTDFARWLQLAGQTPRMIERFWQPVLVSALSESLDRIDVLHARKVFVDGFMTDCDAWQVHLPTVPLSALYDHIQQALQSFGVEFRLGARVLEVCDSTCTSSEGAPQRSMRLHGGETLSARHIILAVPCWQVASLLPEPWHDAAEVRALQQIESAPITSVHLWYDRPITELPHCVLTGRVSQWLFRRAQPTSPSPPQSTSESPAERNCGGERRGEGSKGSPHRNREALYQIVISNSRDLLERPTSDIAAIVEGELCDTFPAAREAKLIRSKVITERRAVFSPTPGVEALRPTQRTPWPGIFWCGDWTATGWPSTMESAVRSGMLAADLVD